MKRSLHRRRAKEHGQSFVEFVLVLPVLLLLLGGLVEVGVFINQYLNAIDLTREGARFASGLDAYGTPGDNDCTTTTDFNYYYDTSCMFSPPTDNPGGCPVASFCNGINSYLPFKSDQDDVVITVITVIEDNYVDGTPPDPDQYVNNWPDTDGWALSDNDTDTTNNANWTEDCKNGVIQTDPTFTEARVRSYLNAAAPGTKGFVAVEFYYCYYQLLHLPGFYQIIPNPIRIHTYTVMPAILPARCMDNVDNDYAGGFSDGIDFDGAGTGVPDPQCNLDPNDPNEDF